MKKLSANKMKEFAAQITKLISTLLALFVLFPPTRYQGRIHPYLVMAVVIPVFLHFIAQLLEQRKLDKILIGILGYLLVMNIATVVEGNEIILALVYQTMLPLALFLYLKMEIEKEQNYFLRVFYLYCLLILISNAISVRFWEYPVGYAIKAFSEQSLIGNANIMFNFTMPALFVGYYLLVSGQFRGKAASAIYLFVILFCLYIEYETDCVTSLLVLLLWTGIIVLAQWLPLDKLITWPVAVGIPAAAFLFFQTYDPEKNGFLTSIFRKLGRSPTLSSRTPTWAEAREIVSSHWLLGVGAKETYNNYFVNTKMNHTHSLFLNVLLKAGIFGFAFFAYSLWQLLRAIGRMPEKKLRLCAFAFVLCVLFHVQFDTYRALYFYCFAALVYYTSVSHLPVEKKQIFEISF